jgi:hypothetical protein
MRTHRQHHDYHGQRQGPPEAAAKIDQFGVFFILQLRHYRLQRHAANRTAARSWLPNLRMHRTGIYRAFWNFLLWLRLDLAMEWSRGACYRWIMVLMGMCVHGSSFLILSLSA